MAEPDAPLTPGDWALALGLLDEALQQPLDQRTAWLGQRLAGSAPAVAAQARRLLAQRQSLDAAGFLDAGPGWTGPGHPAATSTASAPERVGPYRLLQPLGEGGMGSVWLAERDDGQLARRVAIKLPHAGPGQATLAARLLRERDALVALEHPHIARLYDVLPGPHGLPALVLEHVPGLPIDRHCAEHALGLPERLRLFEQALAAVHYAHGRLVLHRDLKPSNILVTPAGEVKLLDFGIAALLGDDGAAPATGALTREGGRPMSLPYASPEQVTAHPLGTASDVYALGVLLYELVTGCSPYQPARATPAALEQAIVEQDPAPPSSRWAGADRARAEAFGGAQPWQLQRALRGDLDAIVLHALRKRPQDRYPGAEWLALDLRRWRAHEPVAARRPDAAYRLGRFLRRHAVAAAASAAVAAALVAGTGVAAWQAHIAQEEARRAEDIKAFLVGLFEAGGIDRVDALRKQRQTLGALLEQSAGELQQGLAGQPGLRTELQGLVGRLLNDLALTDSALALRRTRLAQMEAAQAPAHQRGEALRELAETQAQRGEDAGARRTLEQAVALLASHQDTPSQTQRWAAEAALAEMDLFQARTDVAGARLEPAAAALASLAPQSHALADAWSTLALLRHEQSRHAEALALQHQAFALKQRLLAGEPGRLARERYRHAARLWQPLGDLAAAEPELVAAWQAMRDAVGDTHRHAAVVEQQLGLLLLYRGDDATALARLTHAREVLERDPLGQDPADAVWSRLYEVEAHLQTGRFDLAEPALAEARRRAESQAAGDVPLALYAALQQAELWTHQGRFEQALALLAPWRQRLAGPADEPANPDTLDLMRREAEVHQAAGRPAQALALLDDMQRRGAPGPWQGHADALRASVLLDLGQAQQALPLAQAAFDAQQAIPPNRRLLHPHVAALHRLARTWTALGQPERAWPLFEQALALFRAPTSTDQLYRASLQTHAALALAQLGRHGEARRLLAEAEPVLKRQPLLGPAWWRAAKEARAALAMPPSKAPRTSG
ncbi:MAG: protein kinase domain-containing protein [Pseudomonadota bacterium]